ncbi:MAG TPA: RusA family crossover junction endodeoxyribonuclease [Solirubrobacterales bacterium]|nr:RusA family crossover junction endodeoxyribonuclease [Solirubrobacterales bacterium]
MIGTWTPPEGAQLLLEVEVGGDHIPAGSKNDFAARFKDKSGKWRVKIVYDKKGNERAIISVTDSNNRALEKRAKVIQEAVLKAGVQDGFTMPDADRPLAVACTFYRQRARTRQYGSGRNERVLKETAPAWPISAPDATKLWRGFEDALTGVVWHDDARVVGQVIAEDFVEWWEEPRTVFALYGLPATVAERRLVEPEHGTAGQSSLLASSS